MIKNRVRLAWMIMDVGAGVVVARSGGSLRGRIVSVHSAGPLSIAAISIDVVIMIIVAVLVVPGLVRLRH